MFDSISLKLALGSVTTAPNRQGLENTSCFERNKCVCLFSPETLRNAQAPPPHLIASPFFLPPPASITLP